MDGGDRVIRQRKSLTERLGLKKIGCCGSTWGIMPATTFNVVDDENDAVEVMSHHIHTPPETPSAMTTCLAVVGGGSSRMNLAAALAAERHFRVDYDNNDEVNIHPGSRPGPDSHSSPLRLDVSDPRNRPTYDNNNEVNIHPGSRPSPNSHLSPLRPGETGPRNDVPTYDNNEVNIRSSSRPSPNNSNSNSSRTDESIPRNVPETPTRMSLMRLLEETEVYEGELLMEEDEGVGSDSVCCVCMRRKKGAAFIPCGHTFCRVCSRELWVNRVSEARGAPTKSRSRTAGPIRGWRSQQDFFHT